MSATRAPLLAGLLRNILSGVRLALFMRVSPQDFRVSPAHFAVLFAANFLIALSTDLMKQGGPSVFNYAALPNLLSQVPVILLACLLAAALLARSELLLPLAVALIAGEPMFELVGLVLSVDPIGSWLGARPGWNVIIAYAFIAWWLAIAMRVLLLFGGWRGMRTVGAASVFVLMTAVFVLYAPRIDLWLPAPPDLPSADGPSVTDEQVFHLQPQLLQEALAQLEPERRGRQDLYFLGVAPYASQDVFVREVMQVRQLFDKRFRTAGRSLVLANSPRTLTDVPIATATSLRLTLEHLGKVMNPEEDILFLFITTHGDERHELAFDLPPLNLQQLSPTALAGMLAESGIKWKVLVVSACYSGGYVEPLRDAQTLVITAADAQSTSFGCESGRDYTYFGRAYFGEALRNTYSFVDAFKQAREAVLAQERDEQLPPSSPQIYIGDAIAPKLARLEQQLMNSSR